MCGVSAQAKSSGESLRPGTLPVRPNLPLGTRVESGQCQGRSPQTRFGLCRWACSLFCDMSQPSMLKGNSLNVRFGDILDPPPLLNGCKVMPLHVAGRAGPAGLEPDSLDHWFLNFSTLEALPSGSAAKSDGRTPPEKNDAQNTRQGTNPRSYIHLCPESRWPCI